MARAPFQVLVIPFTLRSGVEVCLFKRSDISIWQFISGGGENDETPLEAAMREAKEEAGISIKSPYYALDTCCSIPAECFGERNRKNWGEDCFVIPEHCFAVEVDTDSIRLSQEHNLYTWVSIDEAMGLLRYDSNKTALNEFRERLECLKLYPAK